MFELLRCTRNGDWVEKEKRLISGRADGGMENVGLVCGGKGGSW
jgi:hypothetical protein